MEGEQVELSPHQSAALPKHSCCCQLVPLPSAEFLICLGTSCYLPAADIHDLAAREQVLILRKP